MLTTREHIIALEPRRKGLMDALLPYPTRSVTRRTISRTFRTSRSKEMLDLAKHIVQTKAGPLRTGQVQGPL